MTFISIPLSTHIPSFIIRASRTTSKVTEGSPKHLARIELIIRFRELCDVKIKIKLHMYSSFMVNKIVLVKIKVN